MTLPTHASIFTGLYARRHGAHVDFNGHGRPLDDKFVTLAEILSAAGYQTLGVVANHVFFGCGFGLEQGFDYFDTREPPQYILFKRLGQGPRFYLKHAVYRALKSFANSADLERHYSKAEDINREALRLLDESSRPFFLFVNYMDAHWPYVPPAPFDELYPGKDDSYTSAQRTRLIDEVVHRRTRTITAAESDHHVSQYDGAIAYMDDQVGELIDRLKALGLYEDALIIVASDHGEALGEKDIIGHALSVYQDEVHIPLLIKYPRDTRQRAVDDVVTTVDILPTVLDLIGEEGPAEIQGHDLKALERGAPRAVFSESFPNISPVGSRFDRIERAVFLKEWKLIRSTNRENELYDLSKDPREQDNLFGAHAGAGQLEDLLNQWLDTVEEEAQAPADLDPETIERLKSLGYIQ